MHPYQSPKQEPTALQQVFRFSEQDLRENRQGKLSAEQATRLRTEASRTLMAVIAVLAVIGIMVMLTLRASAGEMFMLLACLIVPGLFTFAYTLGVTEAAISPRVVSKLTGPIHLAFGMSDYTPPLDPNQAVTGPFIIGRQASYRMAIGNREFRLNKDEYEALIPGSYTVYFVPTLHKIVAIQRVDSSVDLPALYVDMPNEQPDRTPANLPGRPTAPSLPPPEGDGQETIRG